MNLIERYILRRVLALTLTTLVAATVIVLMTQLLQRVNVLTQSSDAIFSFLLIAIKLLPQMAMIVLPFALLIAAARTLSTMNLDSEMAVIESAGGSGWTVARPVLVLSVLLSLVSLGNSHLLEPATNRSLRDTINQASVDLIQLAVRTGSFTQVSSNLYVQVSEELPGGVLGGVVIADARDANNQLIYYAKRGAVRSLNGAKFLQLTDGEVHRKKYDTGEVSIITFAGTALDFSSFGAGAITGNYHPIELDTADLLSLEPDSRLMKNMPHLVRKEVHRRFSEWLYPLAFGLIAVFFAGNVQSHREDRLWKLGAATLTAVVLRGLGFLAVGNSGVYPLATVAAYVLPIATILLFFAAIVMGWKASFANRAADRLAIAAERGASSLARLRQRWLGVERPEGGRP